MFENNFKELIKIYNTLTLVSTKGEDTLIMADCLRALQEWIIINQPKEQKKE